jgi:leader peptidase (prepilin peptidase)/N-methyltransferase
MEFIVFIFGILIGSFLNVVILRYPKGENIAYPASHCPTCKTPLKWWHNIPIISWILLKGKCSFCNEKISIQYPLVELFTGIIFVAVYLKAGLDIFALFTLLSLLSLFVSSMIDLKYKEISYLMNILPITFAFFHSSDLVTTFTNTLFFIGGAVLLRDYVSAFIKKEAMGEGDVLVFATIGAFLGVKLGLIAIFISALYAIIPSLLNRFIKQDLELPFIPFLFLGLFSVWYFDGYFLELWTILYE